MINFLLRVCWDQFVIRPDKIKLYNDCSISRGDRGLMADGLSHVIMGSVSVFTFYGFEGCQPSTQPLTAAGKPRKWEMLPPKFLNTEAFSLK